LIGLQQIVVWLQMLNKTVQSIHSSDMSSKRKDFSEEDDKEAKKRHNQCRITLNTQMTRWEAVREELSNGYKKITRLDTSPNQNLDTKPINSKT
jgi:uncharacterized protein (DUF342 family)